MSGGVLWRVYYADGSTFDNTQGGPELAPALGVLVIAQVDPQTGRYLQNRDDYYIWDDGRWTGVDMVGRLTYDARPGWKRCLFGQTVSNDRFREAIRRADTDPDLPPRAGYQVDERREP